MKFAYASGSRPLDGYTIKRGIGIGGFGEVYFATSDAGKEVAVKRIQRNLEVEVRGVTQCLNLKHPSLIALYDIKYDDHGEAWVVMEFVPGDSLKDLIDRNPNGLPTEQAVAIFEEIAKGVGYLHDHGIVHRDLKPGNIFTEGDSVKIGDYGLSKFISCSRRSGQTESVGTFHYMAPEIGKGVYGKEIDIYALGIILHELLTGTVPFEGETSQEIIMKHLTADPDLSRLDQPFREVIRRALVKDPEKRFGDVAEMLAMLKGDTPTPPEPVDSSKKEVDELTLQPMDELKSAARRAPPAGTKRVPPVVKPPRETIFIPDEDDPNDMVFGPVKDRAPGQDGQEGQGNPGQGPTQAVRYRPRAVAATQNRRPREPVAQAVRERGQTAAKWWSESKIATPFKVILLVIALCALIAGSEWLVPIGIVLGAVYLIYYGFRLTVSSMNNNNQAETAARRRALSARTRSEQAAEWLGSLLYSAVICGGLCLMMMAVAGRPLDGSVDVWSFFTYLTLTSIAGAWMLLSVGKFWEGSSAASLRRRITMLVVGLGVGLASFGAQQVLVANQTSQFEGLRGEVSLGAFDSGAISPVLFQNGEPQLLGHMLFFAGLFFILSWWRQLDPMRRSRFSFWATALCVLWGWILPFPQPWGLMLAAATSIAIQLSAPWLKRAERERVGRIQEV